MFGYKLIKEAPLPVNTSDEKLLRELIQLIEDTSKQLIVEREALVKIGEVQKSITERLDHIESFLDQAYGSSEESEEDRIIN